MLDGSTKKIILGNVDHFLEQIERKQKEKENKLVPVKFEYLVDKNKVLTQVTTGLSTLVSIGFCYLLFKQIKGIKGSSGGMKGGGGD